jgi:hypothetical protein
VAFIQNLPCQLSVHGKTKVQKNRHSTLPQAEAPFCEAVAGMSEDLCGRPAMLELVRPFTARKRDAADLVNLNQ